MTMRTRMGARYGFSEALFSGVVTPPRLSLNFPTSRGPRRKDASLQSSDRLAFSPPTPA